ncbi:hypothetical protein UFOVP153_42 [uncultured Caudovirales phage]|uniref:Uncharacterized protein n=1 Tax=uncultured Caudovirales phage TaxID=2100421 RepID=A0A6J5KZ13_9CAUD|nr:hypothetical protein UFOVP69_16 [uncultured Caudovirales phage]CAB5170843.1 hypothetical protein UFOVP153_42 [uncultured Caudovirales phage]
MDKFNFSKVVENVERMKRELPKVVANDTKNYFVEEYNKQEWNGNKWEQVQRKIPGTKAYKYPKKGADARHGRAILVKTGKLRRAVAGSLIKATWPTIRFEVKSDYGIYHNEGSNKLPQRQFMGDTMKLRQRQLEKIKSYMQRIWA